MDKNEFEKAKAAAYRFLSYRPRSRKETEKKLREKKFSQEIIKKTIDFLEDNKYINDREFTLNWIRYRMENRPLGRASLEYELRKKGISSDLIEESLGEIYGDGFDEYEIAVKMAEKKMVSLKDKRKLSGYLQRKGFSYDTIERVIENILDLRPLIESVRGCKL
ncbi:MAG: regulatory protein RecX [Nitrospinae bacterium]|nr:regulatory protein RecX [Nitrospinota bacterium]